MAHAVERNRLLSELAAVCAEHPLDEKILLVPSFPVGQQILDSLARSGCAFLNLRPATIFSLAMGVAGPALAAEGRRLLSRAQLLPPRTSALSAAAWVSTERSRGRSTSCAARASRPRI